MTQALRHISSFGGLCFNSALALLSDQSFFDGQRPEYHDSPRPPPLHTHTPASLADSVMGVTLFRDKSPDCFGVPSDSHNYSHLAG